MNSFRYQAIEGGGAPVTGVIEAEDRRSALVLLTERGLFPSRLEPCVTVIAAPDKPPPEITASKDTGRAAGFRFGSGIGRKEITAFTREMAALLGAAIPIPQALDGLGEQEESAALRTIVLEIGDQVKRGSAFSAALEEHPRLFSKLYVSMVRVGEEAGALPKVMADLAALLEHEDEVRSEVMAAVAYPIFVLGFGLVTVAVLLTVVLPRLFGMLQEMLKVLPWPTLVLLNVSGFLHQYWLGVLVGLAVVVVGLRYYLRSGAGLEAFDRLKLRLPVLGSVFRAAALSRFARTLGTLAKSGVSLLPALKIVENTIGNLVLARIVAQVAEETRGGDSLAAPLKKLKVFPRTVVQMINVGEETGKLDEMLLKVADIEERHMRSKTKTLISLLAPAMILVVGALVGFMVIALLLPIFRMSTAIH
jgi:type II secretory pathway component PulF